MHSSRYIRRSIKEKEVLAPKLDKEPGERFYIPYSDMMTQSLADQTAFFNEAEYKTDPMKVVENGYEVTTTASGFTIQQDGGREIFPGKIIRKCLYSNGSVLLEDTLFFTNTFLKELFFAQKETINLSQEVIELAKIEERIRQLYNFWNEDESNSLEVKKIFEYLENNFKNGFRDSEEKNEGNVNLKEYVKELSGFVDSMEYASAKSSLEHFRYLPSSSSLKEKAQDLMQIADKIFFTSFDPKLTPILNQSFTLIKYANQIVEDKNPGIAIKKLNNALKKYDNLRKEICKHPNLQKVAGHMLKLIGAVMCMTFILWPLGGMQTWKYGNVLIHDAKLSVKMEQLSDKAKPFLHKVTDDAEDAVFNPSDDESDRDEKRPAVRPAWKA